MALDCLNGIVSSIFRLTTNKKETNIQTPQTLIPYDQPTNHLVLFQLTLSIAILFWPPPKTLNTEHLMTQWHFRTYLQMQNMFKYFEISKILSSSSVQCLLRCVFFRFWFPFWLFIGPLFVLYKFFIPFRWFRPFRQCIRCIRTFHIKYTQT